MAYVLANRIKETSATTGTGSLTLAGAVAQFAAATGNIANGATVDYTIVSDDGTNWEAGQGVFTDPSTLSRDTVHASSNAGSLVNFTGELTVIMGIVGKEFLTDPEFDSVTARGANGSSLLVTSNSEELTGLTGASVSTTNLVPAGARLLYVTARVTTTVTGATSFNVGDATWADRWGSAIALAAGTTVDHTDATRDPESWDSAAQDVVLTAVGPNFTGGAVRVVAFYHLPTAPTS